VKPGTVTVGYLDDHHWSACFGLSLRNLYLHDQAKSHRIMREGMSPELRKVAGTGGIPEGRNELARSFLDSTDSEWLFMVDTDMGFAPETVDELVFSASRYARPVMGGLCFAQRRFAAGPFHAERFGVVPTVYDLIDTGDEVGFSPNPAYGRDQIIETKGTGAACILIHRDALVKVRAKDGDAWFNPITHPTGLRGKPRTFSEDLSFCVRLAAVGVPLHVDTRVKTVHHKGGIFLDEELFLAQQAAAAADQASELAAAG
jgi:hypothetical protein